MAWERVQRGAQVLHDLGGQHRHRRDLAVLPQRQPLQHLVESVLRLPAVGDSVRWLGPPGAASAPPLVEAGSGAVAPEMGKLGARPSRHGRTELARACRPTRSRCRTRWATAGCRAKPVLSVSVTSPVHTAGPISNVPHATTTAVANATANLSGLMHGINSSEFQGPEAPQCGGPAPLDSSLGRRGCSGGTTSPE